jgi:branched-chain amino acid transport system ATP-binding protein
MAAALLEAEHVTKRYGGLVANDAVSVTLAAGEVRGLIGPNGAGKTTFVNLLSGIETADAGRIRLAGTDLTGRSPNSIAAHGMVRTFQVARVFPNLTVRENLLVPFLAVGSPGGAAEGQHRASGLLAMATLEPMADESASALSGGQRMLLQACAGFMMPSVRLHLLDEPFAGINPVVKDTLVDLIERENRSGGAFLIVSHEMAIIRRLCPRVTVMIQGRVAAEGALDTVARMPEVVDAYLGAAL